MKKIMSKAFLLALTLICLSGCKKEDLGKNKPESLTIKEGTLDYSYLQGSTVDLSGLKAEVVYSNGDKKTVSYGDLTISEFSTDTVGEQEVTITYENVEVKVKLKVTNKLDEVYEIAGVEAPKALTIRNNNKAVKENKENEYTIKDEPYYVGDDNPYKFFPKINVFDNDDNKIEINSYQSVSKVYLKVEEAYTELNGSALSQYVTIDDENSTYDFTEAAIGKDFKLSVYPKNLTDDQKESIEDYTQTVEFRVVDGYNVTNAKELGLFSNYNNGGIETYVTDWSTFLTNNNISTTESLHAFVFQNNLSVTKNDIPSTFTYESNDTTYLVDYLDIYTRLLQLEETFTIYGNYFTLSFEELPIVEYTNEEKVDDGCSHSVGFKAILLSNQTQLGEREQNLWLINNKATEVENTCMIFKDCSIIGNVKRANDENGFGGLIFDKFHSCKGIIENCITKGFYINAYAEYSPAHLIIKDTKSYDAYQCLLMTWGAGKVDIINSELKRASGPAMLLQNSLYDDKKSTECAAVVNIDETSVIESYVCGTEAWFSKLGASSMATQIVALGGLFASKSKQFVTDGKMNLISVTMTDGYSPTGLKQSEGSITIGDDKVVDFFYEGEDVDDNTENVKIGAFNNVAANRVALADDIPVFNEAGSALSDYAQTIVAAAIMSTDDYKNAADQNVYLQTAIGQVTLQLLNAGDEAAKSAFYSTYATPVYNGLVAGLDAAGLSASCVGGLQQAYGQSAPVFVSGDYYAYFDGSSVNEFASIINSNTASYNQIITALTNGKATDGASFHNVSSDFEESTITLYVSRLAVLLGAQ